MTDFLRPLPPSLSIASLGDSLGTWGQPVVFPRAATYRVVIDSSGSTVSASYSLNRIPLLNPRALSFSEYLTRRSRLELQRQWGLYASQNYLAQKTGALGGRGIVIETPEIKSKAFRRVFGGGAIGLKVTGQINIDGSMRHEKQDKRKDALTRAPNTNFQMKQTQRFKVEGKIGENVSVFVDQDSERPFEFENAIKLDYSSDEDGIIQRIEAGNVSLSLPGTRFVTFSSQNSGLFGIKSQMKIGPLDVTTIASMEKGKKNTKTLEGGKIEEKTRIWDYQYRRNLRFFVHHDYRNAYKRYMQPNRMPVFDPRHRITRIEVCKSDNNYQNLTGAFEAWAAIDPEHERIEQFNQDKGDYKGYFIRLQPGTDYYVDKDLGYIQLAMPLTESEVLAVAFRDSSGTYRVGDYPIDTTRVSVLKLIKPQNPRPKDPTWNLEWKNIYSLGTRNINKDNFQVKIYFKPPSGDDDETLTLRTGEKKGCLEIFGLDLIDKYGNPKPDMIVDPVEFIVDYANGFLIFPDLRPFDPEGWGDADSAVVSPLPEDKRIPALYEETNETRIKQASTFYIEVNSASRSPNLQLGINVIPESEEVLLNGSRLVRDKDYVIDYFSGQLTLLNERATDPTAKLQVNYESQQMFSIDKKSLLGSRAELTLWETASTRSFIGGTLLYLNQSTLDPRVRIGQQAPMRNIVWGVNSLIELQPTFIDRGLSKLPYLKAQGTSRLKFEGEIAQILPNPNTLNNEATGDPDGVCYLDDFEGAKRSISLGVNYNGWALSSVPTTASDSLQEYLANRGHLYWYNPYYQVPIKEIWPEREVSYSYAGGATDRVNVLSLVFKPNPIVKEKYGTTRRSWAGITTCLSSGYANQEDSKFLDVWVKGDHGRLHIDLGWISEDAIPNRKWDTEDKLRDGIRNQLLDEDEDTGIDGVFGPDPPTLFYPHVGARIITGRAEPYDFWDLNGNGIKEPWEPWSYDDWHYQTGSSDYRRINGTEGNRLASMATYPNSEDLNGNSATDFLNEYFEFSFSLEKDHPDTRYIIGGLNNENGWRLYRIPLNQPSKIVGNPEWNRIRYARIWIDDVDIDLLHARQTEDGFKYAYVSIAEINLVGNEWKFAGILHGDTLSQDKRAEEKFQIEVINTHENAEIYIQPPGVQGDIDPIQQIRQREQALVLNFNGLLPGETGHALKTLYQSQSLLDYKRLKMFVHGGGADHRLNVDMAQGDTVFFFLRLGSGNSQDNYYEIRIPVYDGWDRRNTIDVDFDDFGRLKLTMEATGRDSISERLPNRHVLKVSKKPSLSNIKWMVMGVHNQTNQILSDEIWLNELRLSHVRKDRGVAMRARGEVALSDLFTFSGEYERRDADFHTVNEQFGQGSNSRSQNLTASMNLNKFLPSGLGLSIPISGTFSQSTSIPKWLPGSDILVSRKTVQNDSIWNAIQTVNERKGFSISLSKQTKSRNFFVRYLIDPIQTRYQYSESHASSSQQKYSDNIGINGSFQYNLSFGGQNFIQPLKWLGKKRFIRPIAGTKFYYLPTNLTLNLSGSTTENRRETRSGLVSQEYTSTYNQTFSTGWKPFTSLDMAYDRSFGSDMRNTPWEQVLKDLEPGVPLNFTQSLKGGFSPKIVPFFTPSVRVSSNYRWNHNPASPEGMRTNADLGRNLTFSSTLDPTKFVAYFKKSGPPGRGAPSRAPVRSPRQRPSPEEEKKPEEKKKGLSVKKVFSTLGSLFSKIDPISFSYSVNQNDSRRAVLDEPDWRYRFGLSLDPRVRIYPQAGTSALMFRRDGRLTLRSGVKITSSLGIDLSYEFSNNESRGSQVLGNTSSSSLLTKESGIPFPNWSVSWRGLEKIKFINKYVKQASITHTFSGRMQSTWNDRKSNTTMMTYSKDFRPLLSLNMTLKNGMTVSAQYQNTQSLDVSKATGKQTTRKTNQGFDLRARYTKRGGIKLPFMKSKKLDNNLDFSADLSFTQNKTERKVKTRYQTISNTSNWSFKPKIEYTFSSTVRGGVFLELGQRQDTRMGRTKITAFGISSSISLSGN